MTLLYHLPWVTPPLTCPAPSPDQSGCQIGGKMHRQSRLQRRSHLGRTEGTGEISSGTPTCSETVVLSLLEWHQGLPLLAKHLTVQCVHTCVWCDSCSAGAADKGTHSNSVYVLVVSSERLLALSHTDIPQLEEGGGRLFTSPSPHPSQHSYHTFHPPSTSLFAL